MRPLSSAPSPPATLRLEEGNTVSLADVRAWVRSAGFHHEALELVLTELVANARDHGSGGPVWVDVAQEGNEIVVGVMSSCSGSTEIPDEGQTPPDRLGLRGRGLLIVRSVSLDVHVEWRPTTVRVVARLADHCAW